MFKSSHFYAIVKETFENLQIHALRKAKGFLFRSPKLKANQPMPGWHS